MVFILVAFTFAVIIGIELWRRSRRRAGERNQQPSVSFHSPARVIERYYHPGHCWVLVDNKESVPIGVDDLTQRLVGTIDEVDLPLEGYTVRQGQPILKLHHGTKSLTQVAPITGVVENVNHRLLHRPSLVNRSPYDSGWIARLIPTDLNNDLNNLMSGGVASRWQEAVRMQLLSWFSPKLEPVLQDGGELIDDISDLLTNGEWNCLIREMFPDVSEPGHSTLHTDDHKENQS